MTHHEWGDKDFDFNQLQRAGIFIAKYVRRHSGCLLSWKEKYGTIRYEHVYPPIWCLPRAYWVSVLMYFFPDRNGKFWSMFERRGNRVLWKAIQLAIKKFPQFEDEILEDFASNEDIVGKTIHDKYWSKS